MASNYTEFKIGSLVYLQSYNSVVAKWDHEHNTLTLGRDWNYSMTTVTHIGQFISKLPMNWIHSRKNIQKAITDGRILYDPEMK